MALHTFFDGTSVEFGRGSIDEWCVFHIGKDGSRRPPLDSDYFAALPIIAGVHGVHNLYQDFVSVYNMVRSGPDVGVFNAIDRLSARYSPHELLFQQSFTFMYLGMIAEENKAHARLGKRIKRLGVHSILIEGRPVNQAANFMRGMKWPEISALCKARGF